MCDSDKSDYHTFSLHVSSSESNSSHHSNDGNILCNLLKYEGWQRKGKSKTNENGRRGSEPKQCPKCTWQGLGNHTVNPGEWTILADRVQYVYNEIILVNFC